MSDDNEVRARLEYSVNSIGLAIGELLEVFEKHGDRITEEQTSKVFRFLANTLAVTTQKAHLARATAIASNGAFSLDMELPANPAHGFSVPGADRVFDPERRRQSSRRYNLEPGEDPDGAGFIEE